MSNRAEMMHSVMYCLALLLIAVASAAAGKLDNRIIGGKGVDIEEYPFQASLKNVLGGHFCGGAIVNNKFVLTAAHCMVRKKSDAVHIRVGSAHSLHGGVMHKIKKVTNHPNFYIASLDYDLAILKMVEPMKFSPAVQPISLVLPKEKPHIGDMLIASGWGMTEYNTPHPAIDLHAVRIPLLDLKFCESLYKKKHVNVNDRMLCAGGGKDSGSYKGDSGGPLINLNKQLVGIVSWGLTVNITGHPGVYTNIAHPSIRPFIMGTINETAMAWEDVDN